MGLRRPRGPLLARVAWTACVPGAGGGSLAGPRAWGPRPPNAASSLPRWRRRVRWGSPWSSTPPASTPETA
eukprot:2154527-Lingulodinium_polyedra.AAC.1